MGIGVVIAISAMSPMPNSSVKTIETIDSLGYYKALATTYKAEYEKSILDPAVRMKMIMGMPKDSAITWARKCHYDLNIKALVKWRPDEPH